MIQTSALDTRSSAPADRTRRAPSSEWLEAIRPLSAPLLAGLGIGRAEAGGRRLVFVAASAGAGTTTLATSAASSLARDFGHRVALVEANLLRPALARYLGIDETPGLSELLGGSSSTSALRAVDAVSRLHVLPAGARGAGANVLFMPTLDTALDEIASGHDRVVIDLPPLLESAEGRTLIRRSDFVTLVARAGRTPRNAINSAIQIVRQSGARLAGVVLNGCDRRQM